MVTTWVPELDFAQTASILDRKRLGAQRGEGLIIVRALSGRYGSGAWTNHPAVRMWRGHVRAMCEYGIEVCREWRARGYQDSCLPKYVRFWMDEPGPTRLPEWYGDHEIHECHRRELVRRLPDWYGPIWPETERHEQRSLVWPA